MADNPDIVEIERILRGRADHLTDCGQVKTPSLMRKAADAIEALRAENARLREALKTDRERA
jgi:hypothetical protein